MSETNTRYCRDCGKLMYPFKRGPMRYSEDTGRPEGYLIYYRCPNRSWWSQFKYKHTDQTEVKILKTYRPKAAA